MSIAPGRNLVLIGLPGAGKTSVGKALAAALQRPFRDTDAQVEHDTGRSIAAIFAEDGERAFRALEAAAVRAVSALRGQVVAVGGGAVADPVNTTHLRATGDLVLLDAAPATLAARITAGAGRDPVRPKLADAEQLPDRLAELRHARAASYREAAAYTVVTDGLTPDEVAAAVLAWSRTQPGLLSRTER